MATTKENQKRLAREWYLRNKELAKERAKAWALANPEKSLKSKQKWRKDNAATHNEINRKWYSKNLDKRAAYQAKRRAAEIQRTPPWLTQDHLAQIEELYLIAKMFQMYTGELYHVDHIEPLQGKKVSGLHTPWNLQVLPYKENLKKSNKASV